MPIRCLLLLKECVKGLAIDLHDLMESIGMKCNKLVCTGSLDEYQNYTFKVYFLCILFEFVYKYS